MLRTINQISRGVVAARAFSNSASALAGHSKWANIKHKKARNDKERSAQFTRIAHQITVAAKEGGGPDPAKNIRLATQIETALKHNLPKRVIEAALQRASKTSGEGVTHSMAYEGVGPGGVAVVVEAITDNKNRTAQEVRAGLVRYGGNLAPCLYTFERRGFIILAPEYTKDFDEIFDKVLEFGVDDVTEDEGSICIYTEPTELSAIASKIKEHYKIENMGLIWDPIPDQAVKDLDEETHSRVEKMISALESLDDVHSVSTNLL